MSFFKYLPPAVHHGISENYLFEFLFITWSYNGRL